MSFIKNQNYHYHLDNFLYFIFLYNIIYTKFIILNSHISYIINFYYIIILIILKITKGLNENTYYNWKFSLFLS